MAICNRDFGQTEQMHEMKSVISTSVAASAGQSFFLFQAPYPCTLMAVAVAANSLSGAPIVSLDLKRWTSVGVTTIPNLSQSFAPTVFGASAAYQTMSLVATGSTLLSLQAGDVLVLNQNFSGGNVAMGNAVVTAVVQATQDFKQMFGLPATSLS